MRIGQLLFFDYAQLKSLAQLLTLGLVFLKTMFVQRKLPAVTYDRGATLLHCYGELSNHTLLFNASKCEPKLLLNKWDLKKITILL